MLRMRFGPGPGGEAALHELACPTDSIFAPCIGNIAELLPPKGYERVVGVLLEDGTIDPGTRKRDLEVLYQKRDGDPLVSLERCHRDPALPCIQSIKRLEGDPMTDADDVLRFRMLFARTRSSLPAESVRSSETPRRPRAREWEDVGERRVVKDVLPFAPFASRLAPPARTGDPPRLTTSSVCATSKAALRARAISSASSKFSTAAVRSPRHTSAHPMMRRRSGAYCVCPPVPPPRANASEASAKASSNAPWSARHSAMRASVSMTSLFAPVVGEERPGLTEAAPSPLRMSPRPRRDATEEARREGDAAPGGAAARQTRSASWKQRSASSNLPGRRGSLRR